MVEFQADMSVQGSRVSSSCGRVWAVRTENPMVSVELHTWGRPSLGFLNSQDAPDLREGWCGLPRQDWDGGLVVGLSLGKATESART